MNGSRSCSRSPLPTNAIGTPTTDDNRECRAAARVAVHLRQARRRRRRSAGELAGALDCVLPGHGVGDEQRIDGLTAALMACSRPSLVVDVQPARRVDDDDVEAAVSRLGQRARGTPYRVHFPRWLVNLDARLFRRFGGGGGGSERRQG